MLQQIANTDIQLGQSFPISVLNSGTNTPFTLQSNNTTALYVDVNQNVGIGTSSPTAKLDVNGQRIRVNYATDPGLEIGNGSGIKGYLFYDTTNDLVTLRHASSTGINLNSSGNLGLGVTPSAWSALKAIELGGGVNISTNSAAYNGYFGANCYFNGSNWVYKASTYASSFTVNYNNSGAFAWLTAPSGTAGNAITFTQAMTLDASGNLLVGTTSGISGNGAYGTFGNNNAAGANRWAAFFGTNSASSGPAPNFGLTIGWNKSSGGGESNIVYGTGAGSTPALAFGSSDGTTYTERMRIDSTGRITSPYQPYVEAIFGGSISFTTGASPTTVVYNSVTQNIGSNYNSSTGIFTAPIAGVYFISGSVLVNVTAANTSDYRIGIYKNGGVVTVSSVSRYNGYPTVRVSECVMLAVNDQIKMAIYNDAGTGTTQADQSFQRLTIRFLG